MNEPGEILSQSLRPLFPPDSFLRTLTGILERAHLLNRRLSSTTSLYANNGSFLAVVTMNEIDSGPTAMRRGLQWTRLTDPTPNPDVSNAKYSL